MIPLDEMERMVPRANMVVVERDELPSSVNGIIIPFKYLEFTKSNQVTVLASSVPGIEPGERFMIHGNLTKHLKFGFGNEERIVFPVREEMLVLRLGKAKQDLDLGEGNRWNNVTAEDEMEYDTAKLPGFDEGDPQGLR